MARAPFQIVAFPFRRTANSAEYAIFQRSDDGSWQGIAGGGEGHETSIEAARRESEEEAAIPGSAPIYRLHAMSSVPVVYINASHRAHWSEDVYVIPNYAFAIDCAQLDFRLSSEHVAFKWAPYDEAYALLRWDNNKVALWELDRRLANGRLPQPER